MCSYSRKTVCQTGKPNRKCVLNENVFDPNQKDLKKFFLTFFYLETAKKQIAKQNKIREKLC